MAVSSTSPGRVLGHYRIEEQIGIGGMGVVYRAHDEQLGRDVAIKVIPPGALGDDEARKQFRQEALAFGRLNHPNIAMAFEFGTDDGVDYLVTEYIPGVDLDEKIAGRPLPQRTIIEYGLQLAKGLEAAHRENVIHRDLKPGNIRIHRDGQLKILDFGLARLHEPDAAPQEDTATITEQKLGAGTLPYMAPEQVRGFPGDRRSDIWAAGTILYEMATGHRAFPMAFGYGMIEAIQHSDPVRPAVLNPELPPALEAIIVKALDKDPDRRYQSARELSVDLLRLLPPTQPSTVTLNLPIPRRQSPVFAVVLMVALALVISGGLLLRSRPQPRPVPRQKVLAVLPFDAAGQNPQTAALVMGLTQTLTARLAQVNSESLQLISSREVQAQGVKTAEDAWHEFHTDLVIEGNAHETGNQIRVNCALVDPQTHRQLGARTITVRSGDVFGLEDRVVSEVADILSAEVSHPAVITDRTETSQEAYASYLRARGYLQEYQKPENIDHAIDELQEAVQLDPHFAEAYAELGKAYLLGYQQSNRGNDWVKKSADNCQASLASRKTSDGEICAGSVANQTGKYDAAVDNFKQALSLDPTSEEALRGLADGYESLGRMSDAEATYQRAIAARPRYWGVYSWLGGFYFRQARYADAIAMFQKVVELAPDNYRGFSNMGGVYVVAGRYNDAIAPLQRSIQIRPNLEAYTNLGTAYFYLQRFSDSADTFKLGLQVGDRDWMLWGDYADALYWSGDRREKSADIYRHAIGLVEKRVAVNPRDARAFAYEADYYGMIGDKAKAIDRVERALSLAPNDSDVLFRSAIVYNHFSDAERTLTMLERAVQNGYTAQVIRDTPDFDGLKSNPRYRKLVKLG